MLYTLLLSRGSEYAKESTLHSCSRYQNGAVSSQRKGYMFYREKINQIVRLNIFRAMYICIILFSATVIGDNHDDYPSHTEETLDFHVQRPPEAIWYHSSWSPSRDIAADVEHTHPAQTHSHKNWWGDEDENGEPTETFPEHTHAAYTHGPHKKTHYRPGASGHTPHNSDDLHSHDYIIDYEKTLSHVHPSDTSHMGGRAHSHPGWWHTHGDGEELHEDHEADREHTHPPTSILGPIRTSGHALPYRSYIGYNGYTHTHPDPAFEAHKTEKPPHTDHTSYVVHSHNAVTHTHDDFSGHTHVEHSHSHADDIAKLENHKTERLSHTAHTSFVQHTHAGQTHSHDDYPSHTHNGITHTHQAEINELNQHKQTPVPHSNHKSFVEHTHNAQTHSHDDYPSHTHNGITHTHQEEINELNQHKQTPVPHSNHKSFVEHTHNTQTHSHDSYPSHTHAGITHTHLPEINELEAHRQQRLPHSEHTAPGEHEHTAQPHQHDEYPSHTHAGYTHTHPTSPEVVDVEELNQHANIPVVHSDHKSFVEHTHDGQTHSHDEYPSHTHAGITHTHKAEIDELNQHKQTPVSHSDHKSFVEHTHDGQTHSHDDYPSHTHNGITHTHLTEIGELNQHKQTSVVHSDHKSFVEHTHDGQTHSHDEYPSHTHAGITHTHLTEINELGAHRQQRLPHVEHAATGEHEHTAQPHQHDAYPSHTHASYTHTHPIQPDDTDTGEQNTDTQIPQTGEDNGQQPESEANSEPEPNYTIIPFNYKRQGVGKVVFSELMLAHLDKYPQWIELYNPTDQDIDMNGWKIVGRYLDDLNAVNLLESQIISRSFSVKGKETGLIVSFATPNSRDRISRGLADKAYALGSNNKNLWNYEGLVLELQDAEGNPIDRIGNLNEEDEIYWEIPSVVREKRISLIRRLKSIRSQEYNFSFGVKEFGWFPAEKVEHLIEKRTQYYYGSYTDIGAPGYRTEDGEVLPVTLSSFKAQRNNNNQIVLSWVTESELDNAGFNILRSQSRQGPFVKVNPNLIQGAGTTGERSSYTWTDTTAKSYIDYYYRIEDVSYAGGHQTLTTMRLRGLVSAKGKLINQWASFKKGQ